MVKFLGKYQNESRDNLAMGCVHVCVSEPGPQTHECATATAGDGGFHRENEIEPDDNGCQIKSKTFSVCCECEVCSALPITKIRRNKRLQLLVSSTTTTGNETDDEEDDVDDDGTGEEKNQNK